MSPRNADRASRPATPAVADASPNAAPAARAGALAVAVTLRWGDRVLDQRLVAPGGSLVAGLDRAGQLSVPPALLGADRVPLVRPCAAGPVLRVPPACTGGVLEWPGMARDPRDLPCDGAGHREVLLEPGLHARLALGALEVWVTRVPLPPAFRGTGWRGMDLRQASFVALSLVFHLFLLVMVALVPEESLRAGQDPYRRIDRVRALARVEVPLARAAEARPATRAAFPLEGPAPATLPGKAPPRAAARDRAPAPAVADPRPGASAATAREHLAELLGPSDRLWDDLLGRDPRVALPGLAAGPAALHAAAPVGDDGLPLPAGLSGRGPGAVPGGGGADPLSVAGLSGDPGRPLPRVGLKAPSRRVDEGVRTVGEGLDRETVQRNVGRYRDEVRWCYAQVVQHRPGLQGAVRVTWHILPDGRVLQPRVLESTLQDGEVEACLLQRIAAWSFPSVRGGGVVKVTWPFLFRLRGAP